MGDEATRSQDWKDKAFSWVFQQGISTILLFAFVGWAWREAPALIEGLKQDHRDTVKVITESQERQNAQNIKAFQETAEAQRRHDDEKTRLIRELATERRSVIGPE